MYSSITSLHKCDKQANKSTKLYRGNRFLVTLCIISSKILYPLSPTQAKSLAQRFYKDFLQHFQP